MALLSDIFDIDKETEKQIMDLLKVVGIIALIVGGAGATGTLLNLPLDIKKED